VESSPPEQCTDRNIGRAYKPNVFIFRRGYSPQGVPRLPSMFWITIVYIWLGNYWL